VFTGKLRISRWLLVPEMLLCFGPLTLGWLDMLAGAASVLALDPKVIQRYFLAVPGGAIVLVMMFVGAIVGVLGPVGLIAAFRLIVLGRPLRSRWLPSALVIAPILYGGVIVAFRSFIGPAVFGFQSVEAFDFWSGVLLLSVLPAVGGAHLRYLSERIRA
jgi:energy-converting hydrogenase Eha subunit A